ncbi:polysaccharide lyase family 7 protein [Niastella populi]|uniref:polysaccharide lyase family 7 protein n=1 Tax=Niastella populi TaxID=550983 RepID=UPI0009BFAE40|nr:polysaccharide lyase family 7 protein [Niastella populi]
MNYQQSKGSKYMLFLMHMSFLLLIVSFLYVSCRKTATSAAQHDAAISGREANTEANPTSGWTQTSYTYNIQTPWNLSQSSRYSYSGGEHRFWIYPDDECQYEGCSTGPRSELRMNNNYTSGRHQFEGDVYIVSGSKGTDIMQVFGGSTHATAIMLKIHSASGGTIKRYDNETLMTSAYNKWIHVNVQHDADNGRIYVYINNTLKGNYADRGNATHYFKCGVYNISGSRSETRWKNVKYWKNGPVGQ